MRQASRLFLRFIALLPHRLNVQLERACPILQDSYLLTRCGLVVVEAMHLIVVHFDIASQICTPALVDTRLFTKLGVLHFKLAHSVLDSHQFFLFFFDKPVGFVNLIADSSVVALHCALQLDTLACGDLECRVLPS